MDSLRMGQTKMDSLFLKSKKSGLTAMQYRTHSTKNPDQLMLLKSSGL